MTQQLFFNTITFDLPSKPTTFHFSKEKIGHAQKIHKSLFPVNIEDIIPGVLSDGTEFIYTSFIYEKEGYQPLEVSIIEDNYDLLKRYYNWRIKKYFADDKSQIVKTNFVKDNQIWLRDRQYNNATFAIYKRFTIKIQFQQLSDYGEIIISYDGQTKILKKPVSELIKKVTPSLFKGVLHKKRWYKWEHLTDEIDDFTKTYAILNHELRAALGYEVDAPDRSNKYKSYKNQVDGFVNDFVFTDKFNEILPINNDDFLPVEVKRVSKVKDECNTLVFKNGNGRVPKFDFKKLKPFKSTPHKSIHLFFILHKDFADEATLLQSYLEKEHQWFKGLYNYAGIMYHVEPGFSIVFEDMDNPMPEISAGIKNLDLKPEVTYVALYLSPFGKFEQNQTKREVYYKVKEQLLLRRIVSQTIDYSKLENRVNNFVYELTNISLALLAKLEGVPWQLDLASKRELVIGVGAFKNVAENIQYVASAFSFQNNGKFNGFDYFTKSDTSLLAGAICDAIDEFVSIEQNPDKVVIHFYKQMKDEEMQPILVKMNQLKLNCPLYIVAINKTRSEDLVAFDLGWSELLPKSGTFINISKENNRYLLFNNSRYESDDKYPKQDGFPFPVKLNITSPTPEAMNDFKVIQSLIEQVYQFSRLYWKSLRQQNVPVTIKYPEMVAEIAPHFDGDIPPYGKKILWFL